MKIILAGAGEVGFHLAKLLESESQDITLIDTNAEVLENAAIHLDVMIIRGDCASISILLEADVNKAKLFIAVTTSEKTNLLSAMLAKQLGAKRTFARVNSSEYVKPIQLERFRKLGIDNLFSPVLLATKEIDRLLRRSSFTDLYNFEGGKISLLGVTIENNSPIVGKSFHEIDDQTPDYLFRVIALMRDGNTTLPNKKILYQSGDHLYLVAKQSAIDLVVNYLGMSDYKIKKVMISGGSLLAKSVAQLLEEDFSITLIDQSKERCKELISDLQHTLVIKGNPSNINLLQEEGLSNMDAFLSLTPNSEINMVTSLIAKEAGVHKTIALVDNAVYTHISQNIGIDTIINKKIIAANDIFRFVRKGKIKAITSLHGVNAEIIEFEVYKSNQLTKKQLKELPIPQNALVAAVIRGNESFIPTGSFKMEVNDKVIVFALPDSIGKLERLFR